MSTWRIIPRDKNVPTQWDYSIGDATEEKQTTKIYESMGWSNSQFAGKLSKKVTIPRVYRWFSHENLHL